MYEYMPLLIIGAIIGTMTAIFIMAYAMVKDKKQAMGFDRNMKDSEVVRRLLHYAKPYVGNFLVVGVLMLFSVSYNILSPWLLGYIEDMINEDFEMPRLLLMVAVYGGVLLISLLCTYLEAIILQKTGQKIISTVREETFTHIETLSHDQFHHIPVGTLVTRVTNDANAISIMFTDIVVNLAKNAFIILGVLVAMMILNFALTLMVLCFVPFVVVFTIIFRKFSRRAHRMVKDGNTAINVYLSENLSGMKITQIFNREERKRQEFEERNMRLGRAKRQQIFVFGIFRPMVYMLYVSSVLCLFYLGARGYFNGGSLLGFAIKSSTVVSFYMYIMRFFDPVQSLAEQFNRLQSAFASAEKIFSILDIVPEVVDEEDAVELTEVKGEIEFRDVWFAYEGEEWVLRGVSFHVEAGKTVAFVGSTGSGKTTILSLICRNYDIQKGEILIDGVNIRRYKIASLRRHFGQMLQDVFLFSGTIRSNILLGLEGVDDAALTEACDYVNASHFINRTEGGLDEEVRERGNNFSAGQRQLISFARTIVHKPSVMILDEATANIDTETELLIQDSLEKMKSIGTMLIVAHRLSTIQHADKIIVLSHGEIIESGNHTELLEMQGRYYELYRLQYEKNRLLSEGVE